MQMNIKILNYSKIVYNNFNYIYIYNLFLNNNFIIFFDYKQLKNKEIYQLKNQLYELNIESKVILNKNKKKLFDNTLNFLGSNLFCIFLKDFNNYIKICNILFLKNIKFFYSFKNSISNLLKNNNDQITILGGNVFITIHFVIYKLILNIIIIILYLILILIKYIQIK
jgi:hypothetical protein